MSWLASSAQLGPTLTTGRVQDQVDPNRSSVYYVVRRRAACASENRQYVDVDFR
jgi:hypothetical protein